MSQLVFCRHFFTEKTSLSLLSSLVKTSLNSHVSLGIELIAEDEKWKKPWEYFLYDIISSIAQSWLPTHSQKVKYEAHNVRYPITKR